MIFPLSVNRSLSVSPLKLKSLVIFPLKNKRGEIVSFYGRSINGGHYYNSNRKGLYPAYPSLEAEILILTESVIDAATLKQYADYEVLALYGTNGLTLEHSEALSQLTNLTEVIMFLDGDNTGREASKKYGKQLSLDFPSLKVSQVETPENEDINSLAVNHQGQEQELFTYLLKTRVPFTSWIIRSKLTPYFR